ncbi:MAG: LLM class F420-dependent oxidoreductase [Myxococcales bacterium]|nr:LLM class F420-dependent oxidoreductase [Myxococcales bacterium]HIK86050.1 LLM class F420-dependent oxidoreductase [Myxococcales bacterium]
MKISTQLGYSGGFFETVAEVQELEKAGLDLVWVAEAYGFDGVSLMGYLAAKTETVRIASGILPIYTRTPTLLAMTAAGVDALSNGRAVLGLGASGPQVIEGFHGVVYDAPVTRTREIIEICRKVWKRERLEFTGKKYKMPLGPDEGTGLGKPLKLITHPVREEVPITVAALRPKSVEMTAELADGWLPIFYHAEKANQQWGEALAAGRAKRDPSRAPLEVFAGGAVGIGEGLEDMRGLGRHMTALYVGGMGARGKNFYNEIFAGYGYEKEAKLIQDLYLDGKKQEAAAAIPDSFIEATTLIGPEGFVKERLAALKESGVTTLNVMLTGNTTEERVQTLDKLRNLVAML